jgi:Bacterial protein of unknown function (DUF899)
MPEYAVGTREQWLSARRELLDAEKEHMRQGDELARRRQELPWMPVEKEYTFETDEGTKTLDDVFDGRSQLLVYHFMFGFGFRVDEHVRTQGRRGPPHLLHLQPRNRAADGDLPDSRPDAAGSQRGRPRVPAGVVAPSRRVRDSRGGGAPMIEHRVGTDESPNLGGPAASATNAPSLPAAADRATFQAELDRLRVREKAHTHEGDAIAAARRRLLGHAVVLGTRLRRRAPRRAPHRLDAPRVLPTGRRPRLRNLLDDHPRRRGNGLQLRTHGPHRVRTPGNVGGLAPRLATAVASRPEQQSDERTPHRPVVATRSWTLRRCAMARDVGSAKSSTVTDRPSDRVRVRRTPRRAATSARGSKRSSTARWSATWLSSIEESPSAFQCCMHGSPAGSMSTAHAPAERCASRDAPPDPATLDPVSVVVPSAWLSKDPSRQVNGRHLCPT